MLQRLSIRGKLLAVVAVPTIVLLLATAIVAWNAATSFSSARNVTQLVDTVDEAAPLVEDLEAERATVSRYLRSLTDGNAKYQTARTNVRTTVAQIQNSVAEQPAFAPIADAVTAAVNGPDGQQGLDAAREIATVPPGDNDFPEWPAADAVDATAATYEAVAVALEEAVKGAPVNELGTVARSLPQLVRTEGEMLAQYLNESREYAAQLPATFTATDASAAAFRGAVGDMADSGTNELALARALDANGGIDDVKALRDRVRSGAVLPAAAETEYNEALDDLLGMAREVANVVTDRDLADRLNAYVAVQELIEAMRIEELYVDREIRQGYWVIGEVAQFQEYYFGANNALENATQAVAPIENAPRVPEFGASYDGRSRIGYETIRDRLFNDPTAEALVDQRTSEWPQQVDEEVVVYEPILEDLKNEVTSRAATLQRSSLIQTIAIIAVAVIVVLASQLIAQSIARRIVNPLRRLTTTATAVRQELPRLVERVAMPGQTVDVSEVQIPVESSDEVGRLAEAFNSVNAATLSIAAEQAALRGSISEMFVNVARRDQVLLNRQLASIDEMERTQDDPSTLTKLFALDHLATRMRRNSESLLVLAGIDTGRRLRRPMPLSDVVRTASSEIELYERVQLELDADPAMLGHSALTAAHLFAELLENATVFSDPGTPVVVRTMERDGAVVVTITDSGIGMTSEELAEANSRVASTAASEILGAQRLGLFVVGRIARRVGARVHLDSIEGEGTVATVVMPPSLFDASVAPTTGHHSGSVSDEAMHAPAALVSHDAAEEEQVQDEPRSVAAPAGSRDAYQPTVIEDGAMLLGRDAQAPHDMPSRTSAAEAAPMSDEVSTLMAADAAEAPEGIAFDLDEFTSGATAAGLPTRRRRRDAAPEAPKETGSIIGLPQRASDEQLSALASAATSGFTPILAADEVSPESAEQRARVFRGFRSTRAGDDEGPTLTPDGESLGHAMRREALAGGALDSADEVVEDEPQPTPAAPAALEADVQAPVSDLEEQPYQAAQDDGIAPADPRDPVAPVASQSPLIASGYDHEDDAGVPVRASAQPFAVPALEEDDEVVEAPRERAAERATPPAGVETVSLEDDHAPAAPYRSSYSQADVVPAWRMESAVQRPATQPWAQRTAPQQPPAVQQPAQQQQPAPQSYSAAPAPQAPHPQAAPEAPGQRDAAFSSQGSPYAQQAATPSPEPAQGHSMPPFAPDPVTSTPSLDDLIYDGSAHEGREEKSGFFGRLFGKGGRKDDSRSEAPAQRGPASGSVPIAPSSGATPQVAPAPLGGAAPWAAAAQRAPQPGAPAPHQPVSRQPESHQPEAEHQSWSPAAQQSAPAPSWPPAQQRPAQQPSAQQPSVEHGPWGAFTPQEPVSGGTPMPGVPQAPQAPVSPQSFEPSAHDAARGSETTEWPFRDQAAPPSGAVAQAQPTPSWGVGGDEWAPAEEYRRPVQDVPTHHDAYSPDQLARPMGWEAAGASALQAAAPEVATEYRPVVQIDPEPGGDGGDFASDAFSELSSLAMERPKVEKTRAGLVKRTPVEKVAQEPEKPAAPTPHAGPRDADAVRSRFSAFYSGTQRARDDVRSFEDSTQGSLTE